MESQRIPMIISALLLITSGLLVGCTTTSTTYRTNATSANSSSTISSQIPTLEWSFPEDVRSLYPTTPETTARWEEMKSQMPSIWRATTINNFAGEFESPNIQNFVELRMSPESGALEIINYTNFQGTKRGDVFYLAEDSDGRWGAYEFDIENVTEAARSSIPEQYWKSRPAAIQVVSDKKIKFYLGHISGVPNEQTYEYVSSTSDFIKAEADQQFNSYAALQDVPLPSVWESIWDPDPTKFEYINGYIRLTLSEDNTGTLLLTNTGSTPNKFASFPASGEVIFRGSGPRSTLGTLNIYDPSSNSAYVSDDTIKSIASFKNGRGELKFTSREVLQIARNGVYYPFRFVSGVDENGIPIYPAETAREEVDNLCEEWSFENGMEFEDYQACVSNNS